MKIYWLSFSSILIFTITLNANSISIPSVTDTILYVNENASMGGDGLTWTTAYQDLQQALSHSDTSTSITEIWVAKGIYYPTGDGDREKSFIMQNNLRIYGGFDGTESILTERDWFSNITSLSGDIDQNGLLDTFNSNHIIRNELNGLDSTAILNGFTIEFGYANLLESFSINRGGAMINRSVSPLIQNCLIKNNFAVVWGGAIYNKEADVEFINCRFNNNHCEGDGGAILNFRSHGRIVNCEFIENTSGSFGGACTMNQSSSDIINCTFFNNTANNGGGLFCFLSTAMPQIKNSILWNNFPQEILASSGADPMLSDCIVLGGFAGTNILDVDPFFTDTSSNNLSLRYTSPGLHVGQNIHVPLDIQMDVIGNDRIVNGIVDLGAHEFGYDFPCHVYDSLSIDESPVFPADYKATDIIESASDVSIIGEKVRFVSETEVFLQPDFEVIFGAEFSAIIEDPCID